MHTLVVDKFKIFLTISNSTVSWLRSDADGVIQIIQMSSVDSTPTVFLSSIPAGLVVSNSVKLNTIHYNIPIGSHIYMLTINETNGKIFNKNKFKNKQKTAACFTYLLRS